MAKLIVTTRSGETRSVDAGEGVSVMEAIRDFGIDAILARCASTEGK